MSYKPRRSGDKIICEICGSHHTRGGMLCRACAKAYDRAQSTIFSGDTWDVMVWAARRAAAAERKFVSTAAWAAMTDALLEGVPDDFGLYLKRRLQSWPR